MTRNRRAGSMPRFLFLLSVGLLGFDPTGVNAAARQHDPMAEFSTRVQSYLEIHKKSATGISSPKTSDDPALILKSQQALAQAIQKARPNAIRGDIFSADVRPAFLSLIAHKLSGKDGEAARKTVLGEGNPRSPESGAAVKLSVNAVYSPSAPMSTVPPSLLIALPALPEELEFRFIGRNLILRDTKANLIVDILPDAVPEK